MNKKKGSRIVNLSYVIITMSAIIAGMVLFFNYNANVSHKIDIIGTKSGEEYSRNTLIGVEFIKSAGELEEKNGEMERNETDLNGDQLKPLNQYLAKAFFWSIIVSHLFFVFMSAGYIHAYGLSMQFIKYELKYGENKIKGYLIADNKSYIVMKPLNNSTVINIRKDSVEYFKPLPSQDKVPHRYHI